MISLIIALSISCAVVAYWVACRNRTLKYQARAVELMEVYFSEKGVPQADKEALYKAYLMSRKWYNMPVCALMSPLLVAYVLVKNRSLNIAPKKRARNDLYKPAFDQIMKMTLVKNPIISIISLGFIGLSFAVAIPIGVLLNRMPAMPTTDGVFEMMAKVLKQAGAKAHIH